MSKGKIYICFFFICCFLAHDALGQFRRTPKRLIRKVENYSCPVLLKDDVNQGIGLKVGDPVGVTYKVYFLDRFAFEAVAGIATGGIYSDIIREEFQDTEIPGFENDTIPLVYVSHDVKSSVAIQVRVLMHNPLPAGITGETGVDWYFGIGFNSRLLNVEYTFQTDPDVITDFEIGSHDEELFLYGPEGILGFEYAVPNSRLSAFAEGNVFLSLASINSDTRFYGGLGVRYNF